MSIIFITNSCQGRKSKAGGGHIEGLARCSDSPCSCICSHKACSAHSSKENSKRFLLYLSIWLEIRKRKGGGREYAAGAMSSDALGSPLGKFSPPVPWQTRSHQSHQRMGSKNKETRRDSSVSVKFGYRV